MYSITVKVPIRSPATMMKDSEHGKPILAVCENMYLHAYCDTISDRLLENGDDDKPIEPPNRHMRKCANVYESNVPLASYTNVANIEVTHNTGGSDFWRTLYDLHTARLSG